MNNDQINDLHKHASIFRQMIENSINSGAKFRSYGFKRFPVAQCLNTSQMLAMYLRTLGFDPVTVWSGEHESGSHAWVKANDLIVDITADQFACFGLPPVFVGVSSPLHERYEIEPSYQQEPAGDCFHTYLLVLKKGS